jgi:predicted amidohydrolase YtcJ
MAAPATALRDDLPIAFVGSRILSMDRHCPEPEVVVLEGGHIAAAGERALLEAWPHAQRVDLGERALLPGFIDAHNHLCVAALHPLWADLSQVHDTDELRAALAEQARREPDAEWIRGYGWNETKTGFTPTRAELDALGFDRPIFLAHYTLHQGSVCSRGLDLLGIGRSSDDPPGGEIVRGGNGLPNGLLLERAYSQAQGRSLLAYREPERWAEHIAARARQLLADGITCVHDAACPPEAEAIYEGMAARGELPISVLAMPHPAALLSRLDVGRLAGPRSGQGNERVRTGSIKLFADGGVAPAIDVHVGGHPVKVGYCLPGLREDALRAAERGFRIAIHAIGNAGIEEALGAFEAVARAHPSEEPRFRLEHASLVAPQQIERMRSLGVVGVVQPGFLHHMGESVEQVPFEGATWMCFRSLAEGGVPLAASSDDPCAFHEPLLTSARGTTRITGSGRVFDAEQALPYLDWLRAYTAGAAFAGAQEHERGRLAPGLRADLVLLDAALDANHPPEVAETWVDGRRVWPR